MTTRSGGVLRGLREHPPAYGHRATTIDGGKDRVAEPEGTRALAEHELTALWLLRRIPFAGPLIGLVALSAGIGALVWQLWSRRERVATA